MRTQSKDEAWKLAARLFPTDWAKDEHSSQRAGYSVYRSTAEGDMADNYICDLGDRLELNYSNGRSENIWIDEVEIKRFPTVVVGIYTSRQIFADVQVPDTDEKRIENAVGMILRRSDDRKQPQYVVFYESKGKGQTMTFPVDDVAYIRFEQ